MVVRLSPKWPRHQISVAAYHRMIESGALSENDRVELIHGEIMTKMAIGPKHLSALNRGNRLLLRAVGDRAIVSVQNPIVLGDSEPEPDLALLKPEEAEYAARKPGALNALLLAEISDASLEYEWTVKAELYARNGIREYWIVNLIDETVEVRRGPQPDGAWGEMKVLTRGDAVGPLVFPDIMLTVEDFVGPAAKAS